MLQLPSMLLCCPSAIDQFSDRAVDLIPTAATNEFTEHADFNKMDPGEEMYTNVQLRRERERERKKKFINYSNNYMFM